MSKVIGCRIDDSTYISLKKIASSEDKSVSDLIRQIIHRSLSNQKLNQKIDVNRCKQDVNTMKNENKYYVIRKEIDSL